MCDEILPFPQKGVCRKCIPKLRPIKDSFCCICGKPLQKQEEEFCHDCLGRDHYYTRGRAAFEYQSLADSIYRFKYAGRQEYAEYYGRAISRILSDEDSFRKAEAIIPVPLHKKRKNRRGYNQAELLAGVLGKQWRIPVRENLVIRCKNTQPMKLLNPSQRQNNLKKAFKLTQNDVKLKTIIIVDDIYTTGSTIDAIAALFVKAGVRNIYFITLAIGRGC